MVPKLASKDAIEAEKLALLPEILDQIRIGQETRSGEYELGTGPVASFLAAAKQFPTSRLITFRIVVRVELGIKNPS